MSNGLYSIKITKNQGSKDPVTWFTTLTGQIQAELQAEIQLSAEATAEIMRSILMSSGYKLDKLADTIKAETMPGTGFGKNSMGMIIGKIADLPKDENRKDYWNAFNDGWLPPENWGYFTSGSGLSGDKTPPIAGASGQKWIHTGKENKHGYYYMVPHKPIEPLKFVDLGFEALKSHIEKKISQLFKSRGL